MCVKSCIWFIFLILIVISNKISCKQCGYESCNLGKPGKLNVHLVAHTHDDVGWLQTIDQYFYGAHKDFRHQGGIQYIIDSVIESLKENSDRRFIYVEMAYFWRWWISQTEDMKNVVRQFVNEGRLEFISGGWSMHDEAATHYNSIIDQHTLGAQFLHEEFGQCARIKIGWQIDPFGHSREVASLFAQMGFDGLFFARIDYQDRAQRLATKTMEMIWKGNDNLDRESWLFTGIFPSDYIPPNGSCFDYRCSDDPIIDNPKVHDYNVPQRVQSFIQSVYQQAQSYATDHLMMTMGSDFHYQNANSWFKNLDKLIKYVNTQSNGSNINVFYSSPSCYLYALNKANRTWTTKRDDFFPYATDEHSIWTGYFTSRPALKRYERYSNNILQIARQLNALANLNMRNHLFRLSESMGIIQHHDAISGTEWQHVADDYVQRLSQGIDDALIVINNAYEKLQSKTITSHYLCQLLNISQCLPIENQDRFILTLWNPTINSVTNFIRIPITKDYQIIDPNGEIVFSELIPIPMTIRNIPGRISLAQNEILFQVVLPPLGFNSYYFSAKQHIKVKQQIKSNEQCILQNQFIRVEFDGKGNLIEIINLQKNISVSFSNQGFYWYHSHPNSSGAYTFRPLTSIPQAISTIRNVSCIKSNLVQSALIIFNDWASQQINLYDNTSIIEIEWNIGPIPIDDNIGKELIIRYDTNINSSSKYFTDANGRQVLQRIRNCRPTWNYTVFENVSGNYYPINSRIWIKDQQRQLTILTDRSQGGGSIFDGSIELLIHRRIPFSKPDSWEEPLNETVYGKGLVVRGKHLIIIDSPNNSARFHRITAQQFFMQPISTFILTNQSYLNYSTSYRQTWSALLHSMPPNIHLLTFDQLTSKQYLIRLEHFFELNEDSVYSQPIEIDLQELFQSLGQISNLTELILNGNIPLHQINRLNWTTTENQSSFSKKINSIQNTTITLYPMQIRTFQVIL